MFLDFCRKVAKKHFYNKIPVTVTVSEYEEGFDAKWPHFTITYYILRWSSFNKLNSCCILGFQTSDTSLVAISEIHIRYRQSQYFCSAKHIPNHNIFLGCVERTNRKPCNQIRDKEECLTSRDVRAFVRNQKCVWCLPGKCPNPRNVCEPQKWLEGKGRKKGLHFETCLQPDTVTADFGK